jgi:hypothetical protein
MEAKARLLETSLSTGRHAVGVDERWDGNNTNRRSILHEAWRGRNDAGASSRSSRSR